MKIRASLASLVILGLFACSKPKSPEPANLDTAPNKTTAADNGQSTNPASPAETNTPTDGSVPAGYAYQTIFFDFDSWVVRSDAQGILRKTAADLKAKKSVRIQIEGHCDARGSNEYNLALGERRARAVQDFLVSEGVSEASLSTISYGQERPAVQGTGETVWAKNRRAEFKKM